MLVVSCHALLSWTNEHLATGCRKGIKTLSRPILLFMESSLASSIQQKTPQFNPIQRIDIRMYITKTPYSKCPRGLSGIPCGSLEQRWRPWLSGHMASSGLCHCTSGPWHLGWRSIPYIPLSHDQKANVNVAEGILQKAFCTPKPTQPENRRLPNALDVLY